MKNIVLVGFMGTGKTLIGKKLAEVLKMRYVSLDDMIVDREGKPIEEIFNGKGEAYFRKVEKEMVNKISREKDCVIDAGGGAVIDEENVKDLKQNGILICLSASPEVILERTSDYTHRPLLNVPDPKARIKELLRERAPYYKRADYTIDTSDWDMERIVGEIIKLVKIQR